MIKKRVLSYKVVLRITTRPEKIKLKPEINRLKVVQIQALGG
jgi:hypothetical protein